MRPLLINIFAVIATILKTFPQTAGIDEIVRDIQNNRSSFSTIERVKTDTSYKTIYLKDKAVKFIELRTRDRQVEKTVAWYYDKGEFIYSEQRWVSDSGVEIDHEQFYLQKGKLIKWVRSGKNVPDSSYEYKDLDSKLGNYGLSLKNKL